MNRPAPEPVGSVAYDIKGRDLARGPRILLIWIAPIILLAITAGFGGWYAALSWPPLLVFMAAACLVNARRCGRMHCYFTGPFFLLLAAAALSYSLGMLPLGPRGWQWLSDTLVFGSVALCCIPEWLLGRYAARR